MVGEDDVVCVDRGALACGIFVGGRRAEIEVLKWDC